MRLSETSRKTSKATEGYQMVQKDIASLTDKTRPLYTER